MTQAANAFNHMSLSRRWAHGPRNAGFCRAPSRRQPGRAHGPRNAGFRGSHPAIRLIVRMEIRP